MFLSKTLADYIKENHHRFHFFFVLIISTAISLGFYISTVLVINAQTVIETYPGPGVNTYQSDLYSVEVFNGTSWVQSYTYKFGRTALYGNLVWVDNDYVSVNFTTFGTSGPANVRITRLNGPMSSVSVSPLSRGITANISANQATLTLNQGDKTWITINGDNRNPLFIFADPPKPAVPAGATYFGPGVHNLAPGNNNRYQASNNEVIYIDGGAWVRGNIHLYGTSGVRIMGPGILSGDVWTSEAINPIHNTDFNEFTRYSMIAGDWNGNSANASGITIVNAPGINMWSGITNVNHVKVLSPWYPNSDAFHGVSHVDRSFAFVGDNVVTPIWAGTQNENFTVTNSFIGTSNSAPIAGSYWGNPSTHNYTALVDNVDIKSINFNNTTPIIQIWVDNADSSYGIRSQTYQNIRVEGSIGAPLIHLKNHVYPFFGAQSYDPPLGNSYNIVFRNITLTGTQTNRSQILGHDINNRINNVTLENVRINGTLVTPTNVSTYFDINNYVTGLSYSSVAIPTVTINASPANIQQGNSSTITWSSSNATSCSASGAWTGARSLSGSQSVSPSSIGRHTYTISCVGSSGFVTEPRSVVIDVSPPGQQLPIGFWSVNEGSGTTTADSSGNNNNGTLINGPAWTTGKLGQALSFDGIDDRVAIMNATGLSNLGPLTISAWINANTSGGSGSGRIVSKGGIAGTPARFALAIGPNNSIGFVANYSPSSGVWTTQANSLDYNNWHHVVAVYWHGDINDTPAIYIDGVPQSLINSSIPSGNPVADDGSFFIGSRGINNSVTFDGAIDQVRIYNRELSSAEVLALYNSENIIPTPTPTPIFSDTTPPTINSWDVQPRTTNNGSVTISWSVSDSGGSYLNRVEIQRTSYNATNCNGTTMSGCAWAGVGTINAPNSVNTWTSNTTNTNIPIGSYYYGLHVIDGAGNRRNEATPIRVDSTLPTPTPTPTSTSTPIIQNVQGNLSHNSVLNIQGSNFGNHSDWGGSENFIVAAWNDFSAGLEDGNWRFGGYPAMNSKWSLQTAGNRGNPAGRFARKVYEVGNTGGAGRLGAIEHIVNSGGLADRFYVSFWFKQADLNVQTSGKNFRQYYDFGNFWTSGGHPGSDQGNLLAHSERGTVSGIYGSSRGPAFLGETWTWQEFLVCLNGCESEFGSPDYLEARINGQRWWRRGSGLPSNHILAECSTCNENQNWVGGSDGDADGHSIDMGNMINDGTEEGETGIPALSHYDYSDIYVNYGFERVCISSSPTWSSVVSCEQQIPISWSSNGIQVQINQGALGDLSNDYLYVVNSNNRANEAGFPLGSNNPQPCSVTSASWQQAQYTVGDTATMNVTVSNPANCTTNNVLVNIYDEDPFSFDDLIAGPISQQFNQTTNQTTLTYTFTAQDYIDGGNESGNESIYFTAQVQGQSNYVQSSQVNFYNSAIPKPTPSPTPTSTSTPTPTPTPMPSPIPIPSVAQYVSFTSGNPGSPNNGSVVSAQDGFFNLTTPLSLAGITNGFTITAFPESGASNILNIGLSISALGSTAQCRGVFGVGTGITLTSRTISGIDGRVSSFPQSVLNWYLSAIGSALPGCNLGLSNLAITAIRLQALPSGSSINRLDAAAIGSGQNTAP